MRRPSERAARVRWLAFRWSERCVGAVGRVARVGCLCGVRRFRARCAAVSPGKFLFFSRREQSAVCFPQTVLDRVSIYWTETQQWFEGTFKTSRVEAADGGGKQRTSCVLYDATGLWARCTQKQLTYWHCLDDEQWSGEVE